MFTLKRSNSMRCTVALAPVVLNCWILEIFVFFFSNYGIKDQNIGFAETDLWKCDHSTEMISSGKIKNIDRNGRNVLLL